MHTMLDWALHYANLGWPVIPLHSVQNGRCSCGNASCKSPGKHPRTRHGVKEATKDPAVIRNWWAKWLDANIGIATGQISGLTVIDIDGESGLSRLNSLATLFAPLPATLTSKTAR